MESVGGASMILPLNYDISVKKWTIANSHTDVHDQRGEEDLHQGPFQIDPKAFVYRRCDYVTTKKTTLKEFNKQPSLYIP